jgi:hypothetical protein
MAGDTPAFVHNLALGHIWPRGVVDHLLSKQGVDICGHQ